MSAEALQYDQSTSHADQMQGEGQQQEMEVRDNKLLNTFVLHINTFN